MRQIPNEFVEYEFTELELYQATRFNEMQKSLIRTLITQEARRKLELKVNLAESPNREKAVQDFIQVEAECQGGIRALQWLLWLEESTEAPLPESAETKAGISKPAVQS